MARDKWATKDLVSMKITRILVGFLSLVVLALLGWCNVRGVGDLRTQVMLGIGSLLGILYTIFGHLPDWIISHSGGSIVADDDPGNISPRVYLSVIGVAILLAVVVFVVVMVVL